MRLAAGVMGLAINAALLALLTLDRRASPMIEPHVVDVALEPREPEPEPRTSPTHRPRTIPSARAPSNLPAPDTDPLASPTIPTVSSPPRIVDRRWWVGNGEYLDPVTARRARRAWEEAEKRRFKRACLGQSIEAMTDEEKTACWEAWSGGGVIQ